ncbi:MAG TPA: sigma-70 family RNA polymerase sigma factor [Thermoanaerobaculia bacterium]|nr:sigma-70 family RNA polymerase sigma factor [Thermoanaerobaculia bacterium]
MKPPYNGIVLETKKMRDEAIQEELRRALAGEEPALTRLVQRLTPVIQCRVARGLRSSGRSAGRDVRQEVEDFTQEIFLFLFADDGKALRRWDPERGLSLLNFVGLAAKSQTASILRSGKRNPWKEEAMLPEDLDQAAPDPGPEAITASREQLEQLLDRLAEELSPLGLHLFDLLFLRELSTEEVMQQTNMTSDAVYAWRSRLRKLAERLLAESETEPEERTPLKDRG